MGDLAPPRITALADVPRRTDGRVDLDRIVAACRLLVPVQLLESSPGAPGAGRWSYVTVGEHGRLTGGPHGTVLTAPDGTTHRFDDPFGALDAVGERFGWHPDAPASDPVPLAGGLVGAFSYDLARATETLPELAADDREIPWLDLRLVDTVLAVDHHDEQAYLAYRPLPGGPGEPLPGLHDVLRRPPHVPAPRPPPPQPVVMSLSRDRYRARVTDVLEDIAAGRTWQVNLSRRLTARWPGDVHDLYRALRAQSPAPYGAVVVDRVASISPETFLRVQGRTVTTRPIKGTRPRSTDAATDRQLRDELERSDKDRAENVMVVDMERNDLGRVAVPGSVRTPDLLAVEQHPTVWHLVSTVTAQLRADVGYGRLLRAAFPCGSVTGTPKVAAMGLIDRYEPVRRGWYCGAVGYVTAGAMHTSVAIRTATRNPDGSVDYGAGGGIVADSDPTAEDQESLDKARAFLSAVNGTVT